LALPPATVLSEPQRVTSTISASSCADIQVRPACE
jgi:hypothetical protein